MEAKIGERQRRVWLAAALSPVAASVLSGLDWLWVLLGGTGVCLYYYYIEGVLPNGGLTQCLKRNFGAVGKPLMALSALWLVFIMGYGACLADAAFPMQDGFPGLGWVLLALAAWGSRKGARTCAACCGVVALLLAALYGAVAVFAVSDVKAENLLPAGRWEHGVYAAGAFLLPAAVWYIPVRGGGKRGKLLPVLPLLAAAAAAVAAGVLSPEVAQRSTSAMYELARSVSVLGVVERIEPLLSAAMTMGVFCLLSQCACAVQTLLNKVLPWKWWGSTACLGAALAMYLAKGVDGMILTLGNAVFFLVIPLLAVCLEKSRKNRKKVVDKQTDG